MGLRRFFFYSSSYVSNTRNISYIKTFDNVYSVYAANLLVTSMLFGAKYFPYIIKQH